MPWFRYKAMTPAGAILGGVLEAANLADLETRLMHLGLDLIDGRPQQAPRLGGRVPRRELITFFFHLEQLAGAGIPLVDALKDMRDATAHRQFRSVLVGIVEAVEGGRRLSEAMAGHRGVFDAVTVSLVRAGEDSGTLLQVFGRLIATLKWQDELAAQARRLALYPGILALATFALLAFMLTYLVPRLTGFLQGAGQTLPWHTEVLIAVSRAVTADWYLFLGVPLAAAILGLAVRRQRRARLAWDSIKLRLPLFGNILRRLALARFAGVLALLYEAGIPILDAMRATEKVVGNAAIARSVRHATRAISAGETIAVAFERAGLFSSLVIRMLHVGENSGALDKALANAGYFLERDVREAVHRLAAAMEPTAIAILGGVIGWIVLSVLGPIYQSFAGTGF